MKFTTTPLRVVNRNWKKYIADDKWLILSDSEEMCNLFKAYWFETEEVEEKTVRDEYIEVFWKKPWNLSEEKMKAKILEFNSK